MKHEILLEEACTPKQFLALLYQLYPYDIEQQMVYTLLDKDTYPHPALLKFIAYFAQFPKYRVSTNVQENSIDILCANMSRLFQNNKNTLHTYVFHFDATLQIMPYKMKSPYAHLRLANIPFISIIQLHMIPILSMNHDYIEHPINKSNTFIFKDISIDANAFYALSIKVSDKHGIVYVPRDQIGIAIAISSIYEVVPPATEIDFLLLYGLHSHEETLTYYFDETNQLYIGLIAGNPFYHFVYVMQMITTLYNAICIDKSDLPIHACMLQIGSGETQRGILLAGNDCTGKSEVCDCLRTYCETHQIPCTCVFENCGTLHFLDNEISATGIQIGACVSIHGLSKESIFQKLPVCAFLKSDQTITHILFPFTSFKETTKFHKVHSMVYLNRKDIKKGYRVIKQLEEAKHIFMQEIHSLKSSDLTPHEKLDNSISKQHKNLIDHYFNIMMINDLNLGEIYIRNKRYRLGKCLQDIMKLMDIT